MRSYRFIQVDVFTETPFGGNPLAVFHQAEGLSTQEMQQLAKEMNGYIYGEKENGGTNTIYVSPVPFDELNKAVEKGKGKPHLKPVEDMMAKGNNLAKAMVFAPLAGVAAAVGKYYKMTKD